MNIQPLLRIIAALGLTVATMAGCAPASPRVTFYTLLDTEAETVSTPQRDHLVLLIGPVSTPDILKKTQIAIGGKDGGYQLSEYHRWAGDVDRDFARAMAIQLTASLDNTQAVVFPGDGHRIPNLQVRFDVQALDGELGQEARLVARWTLFDPTGKLPPVTRLSRLNERPSGEGYDAWIRAQQLNLRRLGEEITTHINKRQ